MRPRRNAKSDASGAMTRENCVGRLLGLRNSTASWGPLVGVR